MGTSDASDIQETAESVALLTRSGNRVRILRELVEHETLHRDALTDATDVSRTTLNRNLESLEEEGWIREVDRTYRITPCGELVATEVLDLIETTRVAKQLQDALQYVPVAELDLDLRLLRDADVRLAEPGDPYAMVNRHVRTIRNMDEAKGLLRVTGLHANEAAHEAITERGAEAELVVTPAVAETLTSKPEYASVVEEMRETGRYDVYVYEGDVPFSLAVIDDTVQLLADEDGEPRALVETDADEVREWAEERYAACKRQADPLE